MPKRRQPFTLPLDSASHETSSSGGKGHNLSVLLREGARCGVQVPPGFVVTADAYREFVGGDGEFEREIEASLAPLRRRVGGEERAASAELEAASAAVRAAFRRRRMPGAVRSEIDQRLGDLLPSDRQRGGAVRVAVRSSATCEDAPDASFAGQHETFLNVVPTADEVCRRAADCFSSLFTGRSLSYRMRNGMPLVGDAISMAVVVQEMVDSQECSGVLFTANPLTERRSESVLEAVPGLGEALVSGLTEPDRYVASRRGKSVEDDLRTEIVKRRIGAKAVSVRPSEGGGISVEEVTPDSSVKSAVLRDEDVLRIVRLGQQVEAIFGGTPQDIEWAQSTDGTISVVQSRPITTFFPLPNVPERPIRVFFSFNAVQGIPLPIYPSGQDALRKGLLGGLLRWITWGRYGDAGAFLEPVAERLYIDVTTPLRNSVGRWILRKLVPSIEPGIMAGMEQLVKEPDLSIDSGMSALFFLRMLSLAAVVVPRYIFSVLFPDWSRRRLLRRVDNAVNGIRKRAADVKTLADVVALERDALGSFFPCMVPHLIPRLAAAMGPLFILTELASSIQDGKSLVLTITRGLPHNVTTEMDLTLWQVAKVIQQDPLSLEHFRLRNADTLAENYLRGKLPRPAHEAVGDFMSKYGMRGLYEIDFGRPRWREEPAPLMNTLKSYIEMKDNDQAPDRVFAAGKVAADDAIEKLGQRLRKPWLVSFLARRVRSLAGIRELPKFAAIRIMGFLRAKLLEVGGVELVETGVINEARDLFFLRIDELEAIACGELRDCRQIVQQRKARMEAESKRTRLPRVIASDGFAYYGGSPSSSHAGESSDVLRGEPVSPGTYEGRVHVIHDPSEAKLSQGQILCCHGTDPSWTPLFLSAGALVMEVGGLMTHGSVVAREYGIPAVVGLDKVTEVLFTGQLVRVDGSSGTVELIDKRQ